LRLSQTGASARTYWSLQEIRLYAAASAQAQAQAPDPAQAVAAAQAQGARFIYADHRLSAFVPRQMRPPLVTPPASPAWPLELDSRGTLPSDLDGVALAVTAADAPGVGEFLEKRGIVFEQTASGGFVVFHHLRPPRRPPATVRPLGARAASSWPGSEGAALDGNPATAWSTGRPRAASDFFQVDLGREVALDGLTLDNPAAPSDLTRGLTLELSDDGRAWRQVAWQEVTEGPIYFAGDRLLGAQPGRLRLRFPAQNARHLRLSLRQGHMVAHWGIAELGLSLAQAPGEAGGQAARE
jgi:hypothetical protein